MRVFLCWTGTHGKSAAIHIERSLKRIVKGAEPWLSEMIPHGENQFLELQRKLHESSLGIICLTRAGLRNPWVHFEAGAIAKEGPAHRARIWVLCLGLSVDEVPPDTPLYFLQRTGDGKEQVRRLFVEIDHQIETLSGIATDRRDLDEAFEREWPAIGDGLENARQQELSETDPFWYWRSTRSWDLGALGKELDGLPARIERIVRETHAEMTAGPVQHEFWFQIDVEHPDLESALRQLRALGVLDEWGFRSSADVQVLSNVGRVALESHLRPYGLVVSNWTERKPGQPREFHLWDSAVVDSPMLAGALDELKREHVLESWELREATWVCLLSNVDLASLKEHFARHGLESHSLQEMPPTS